MSKPEASTEKTFYHTIDKPGMAEFKDRGSKFIAYSYPVESADDFKKHLQELKKEHPKAVHHCFAYRIGTDGNNFRVSDDGEPSGSAGRPILGQIDSRQITNTAVIVVRYFGGTLLGVPGLINAYKTVTSLALQVIPVVQKQIEVCYRIQFDYTRMNDIMMVLKQYNCSIISQDMQLFCVINTGIPNNRVVEVVYKLKEMQGVDFVKS
ncbi:MAG: YigZ family protein [Chitinophagaceae bacterium]|nr:YigZ family protein [Chitinophagaceae bacterium]